MVSFGSGVTDPYQPLEATNRITCRCSELLANSEAAFPALVMTKSSLITRDLPYWKRVNERSGFVLEISLTSLDEGLRGIMEPGASSFAERLATIRAFKVAGCAVGVLAMPFLPGLSDGEDSIRAVYTACAEAGADFVMPGGLTLRPGRQKEFYISALTAHRPDLVGTTIDIYREERPSGMPLVSASRSLFERIAAIRHEFSMPFLLPHRIFACFLPPHDALRVLFRDMFELYADRGVDTTALATSATAFDDWLISLRRAYRRRRNLPDAWLEERFSEAARDGELDRVLSNKRLARFVHAVVLEGARLDYTTLRLEPGS
jgi:hypothetical protein